MVGRTGQLLDAGVELARQIGHRDRTFRLATRCDRGERLDRRLVVRPTAPPVERRQVRLDRHPVQLDRLLDRGRRDRDVTGLYGIKHQGAELVSADGVALWQLDVCGIAAVSGEPFGAPGHIRFSYAAAESVIDEALAALKEAVQRSARWSVPPGANVG